MKDNLLIFFTKGLIITLLIVLGLFLLGRMRKILTLLFFGWLILAIVAFPIVLIGGIILLGKAIT